MIFNSKNLVIYIEGILCTACGRRGADRADPSESDAGDPDH
jgi:hypothetical protein